MDYKIKFVDNVLTAAELSEVQQRAAEAPYQTVAYGGALFPGMAITPIGPLDRIARDVFGVHSNPGVSYFRKGNSADAHESFIHYDIGLGTYSLILYLSDSAHDGTAFWRHRATNRFDATAPGLGMQEQWHAHQLDENHWQRLDLVTMKVNRAICFPTSRFHSRWPFQPTIADRLIQVGFFA